MTAATPESSEIQRIISAGDIRGERIIVGDKNIMMTVQGNLINVSAEDLQPHRLDRPAVPELSPFPGFLNRRTEVGVAQRMLGRNEPIEFHGPSGIGKSVLLRHVAFSELTFRDGIASVRVKDQPVADVLQKLVSFFYISQASHFLLPDQLIADLGPIQALIVLDDVELPREDLEEIMNTARSCAFVIASSERRLWGSGRSLSLGGLPVEECLTLVERELGRRLEGEERSAARSLVESLEGHPLNVLQEVDRLNRKRISLVDAARQLQAPAPVTTLTNNLAASLTPEERQIWSLLGVMRGTELDQKHITAVVKVQEAAAALQLLQERGPAQAQSPRFVLAGPLADAELPAGVEQAWQERLVAHFVDWTADHDDDPALIAQDADAIVHTLRWAYDNERWFDVLSLVKGVEGALFVDKRWERWREVLSMGLHAARTLGYPADEAWALHQLGSRSMCLGDNTSAASDLTEALRIRRTLGEAAAIAVTQHNLDILLAPPAPPVQEPQQPPTEPASGLGPVAKIVIAMIVAVGLGVAVVAGAIIVVSMLGGDDGGSTPIPIVTEEPGEPPVEPTEEPSEPPTEEPPQPVEPPLPPEPLRPSGLIACEVDEPAVVVDFAWRPQGDLSAIDSYELRIAFHGLGTGGGTTTSDRQTQVEIPCEAGESEWQVRAIGLDGQPSEWSEPVGFFVEPGAPPPEPPGPGGGEFEDDTDRPGADYDNFLAPNEDPAVCRDACLEAGDICRAWTFVRPGFVNESAVCFLKNEVPEPVPNDCCVSGVKLEGQ